VVRLFGTEAVRLRFFSCFLVLLLFSLVGLVGCAAPKRVYRQPPAEPTADTPSRSLPSHPDPADTESIGPGHQGTASGAAFGKNLEFGRQAAGLAREQIGRPYRLGGETPAGFDCSGLVHYVYGLLEVPLPRTVAGQLRAGRVVPSDQPAPGDLVFFRISGSRISHVGIYLGGQTFVHAPRSGRVVQAQSLSEDWWQRRLAAVRRVY
jgi:cell wall-associated NlpC family hydrolase